MEDQTTTPFHLSIPEEALKDLQTRLSLTRWPDAEPVSDWSQGVPLSRLRDLHKYWTTEYSWARCESFLNSCPQYTTHIDGVEIYFLHIKSRHPDATPLLLTHGWPGSILEFRHVIEPLTNPTAHGGSEKDAFHLVIPALPGYAFSGTPTEPGWDWRRIARVWIELMRRLGYKQWCAQGGDWGADVTAEIGRLAPEGLIGVHMNSAFFNVREEIPNGKPVTDEEKQAVALQDLWEKDRNGYQKIQGTRPQTVGYGLADSPVAQLAWIYEKLNAWSDHADDEEAFSIDDMLDNVMLYWWANAGASSARIYWEGDDTTALKIDVPVGVSLFPRDPTLAPREWAERYYRNLVHWKLCEKGGHFASWEQPGLFTREVREWARSFRS